MKEIKYINKYQQLMDEIETYRQVIQEAKEALDAAEMELGVQLDEEF